ncbi:MAG TPA: EAL domain-containing response regulator [Gammaproteobacteria bacterium]|nr:EAL domain-containing response regulator [Gammaproteobacteria bacterium]
MADNVNRLLIVEEERAAADFVAGVARNTGYAVACAPSSATFVQLLESFQPSLIVMDLSLPDADGVELLRSLASRACPANVVLMSAGDERVLAAAHDVGLSHGLAMCGTLAKPVPVAELKTKLAAMLHESPQVDVEDLRRGIASGELVPYYQPKASLVQNGWVVDGVEALARWQHPRLGLVMPNEFIPLAEQSGLIGELTDAMLRAALLQVRSWQQQGLRLTCAVNLPPSLVTDLRFPDRLTALLAEHGVDGGQLVLEITETATIQNPTATMGILTRLRVKRIGLSLDDFGTGYSSLTQLYQMPFNEMKIDKSLVMNVPHSREANTMVGSLIELGHNLGLKICAEGVENRAALDMLAIMGCDRCQGYFISRAIPAAEIASFVTQWNRDNPASSFTTMPRAVPSQAAG